MKSTILMAIFLALGPASLACGQFVLDSLPKPGSWAKYQQSYTHSELPDYNPDISVCIRCLANESSQEPKCVWIEIEVTRNSEVDYVYKLLMPESEFKPSGDPLRNLVKGWVWQQSGSERRDFQDPDWVEGNPKPLSHRRLIGLRARWIVTPPDDAEQLMSDIIDVGDQKLKCKGISYSCRWSLNNCQYLESTEIRLAMETPFGLVCSEQSRTTTCFGEESLETRKTILIASGDDAVSALPDIK